DRLRSVSASSLVPVIFLSQSRDLSFVVRSMRLGAFSVLAKPWAVERLLHEVNEAYEATKKQEKWMIEASSCMTRLASLSGREQTIVDMIVEGNLTKEIAADLKLSEKTVENHRRNILKKTGARCVADLVRMAVMAQIAST